MNGNSDAKAFFNALETLCEGARREYELTYLELIGVLEMKRQMVVMEYLDAMAEGEDD